MPTEVVIAPSLLSADFACLAEDIKKVEEAGARLLHIDVMDGHFVPNLTVGPAVVESIRKITDLPLDVHLMIDNPERYIDSFAQAGADWISVHYESTPHIHRALQMIKAYGHIEVGIALNPSTPLAVLAHLLEELNFVLLMTVNPGFEGQVYINQMTEKIKHLKQVLNRKGFDIKIEVDGGINEKVAKEVVQAGAQILVAGSAIFRTPNPAEAFLKIKGEASKVVK